jgi:hypothetical protein
MVYTMAAVLTIVEGFVERKGLVSRKRECTEKSSAARNGGLLHDINENPPWQMCLWGRIVIL